MKKDIKGQFWQWRGGRATTKRKECECAIKKSGGVILASKSGGGSVTSPYICAREGESLAKLAHWQKNGGLKRGRKGKEKVTWDPPPKGGKKKKKKKIFCRTPHVRDTRVTFRKLSIHSFGENQGGWARKKSAKKSQLKKSWKGRDWGGK